MPNPITHFISSFSSPGTPGNSSPATQPATNTSIKTITKASSASFMDKIRYVAEKVKQVALFALAVGVSALLFWVNPSLCAIGFIAGIIFDEQVREAIQKIKDVWNNQKILGTFIGICACGLSMPVTLATASLLWSAHFGSLMTQELNSQKNKYFENAVQAPLT